MKLKWFFSVVVANILILFTMTGCEVDYYQPSESQESSNPLFGDSIVIPEGFDWSMMRSVQLNVKVNDQYNGKYYYQVEVYDANPIFFKEANLLAKGVAKKGYDWVTTADLFTSLDAVYVRQVSPTGQGIVKVVSVSGENISVDFGSSSSSVLKSVSQAGQTLATTYSIMGVTRSDEGPTTSFTTPAIDGTTVQELSGEKDIALQWNAPIYVIPAGKTFKGNLSFSWKESTIYVEGTWENTSSNLALNGWTIIIQDGGKFISDVTSSMAINGSSHLIVAEGGEFSTEGSLLSLSQGDDRSKIINSGTVNVSGLSNIRYLYNYGIINVEGTMNMDNYSSSIVNKGQLIINNGTSEEQKVKVQGNFQNEGTVRISGKLNPYSNNFSLDNAGFFEVQSFDGQGTIDNSGQFVITDNAVFTELVFNIHSGALLECKNLTMKNCTINMDDLAMLDVTEKLTVLTEGSVKIITGPGAGEGESLAKINTIEVQNYSNFALKGELQVECSNYTVLPAPGEKDESTQKETGPDVEFVAVGESTVNIPATTYNKGGNSGASSGTPTSPAFPIIYDGSSLTYLFEDNWPILGDYDMNDLVAEVTPTYSVNANNKVTQLKLAVILKAVGASRHLAVGLQLDGITTDGVASVSRSDDSGINGDVFSKNEKGLESGQTYAVIPIFDDAHLALGKSSPVMTNTIEGSNENVDPKSVTITIDFNNEVDQSSLSVDKFNLFIINGGYKSSRQEVHLAGFASSDKADRRKFGTIDSNSGDNPYVSKSNLIWALAVPGSVEYPKEWNSIRDAYPDFEGWAMSGGMTDQDWYGNPDGDKVY